MPLVDKLGEGVARRFNGSLDDATLPGYWLESVIAPEHKEGEEEKRQF